MCFLLKRAVTVWPLLRLLVLLMMMTMMMMMLRSRRS
jgi:hypothetical protein